MGRSTVLSMCIIFILIFFFIPWQVAYLGCWVYQFLTCATGERVSSSPGRNPVENHPLVDRSVPIEEADDVPPSRTDQRKNHLFIQRDNYHLNCHILLFMTWLLPLAAPVLAVWVRTLFTAGLTTPFDGDHFFLNAAPFLVLVDFSSWTSSPILRRQRYVKCIKYFRLTTVCLTARDAQIRGSTIYTVGTRSSGCCFLSRRRDKTT